jgi:hypothetical protein
MFCRERLVPAAISLLRSGKLASHGRVHRPFDCVVAASIKEAETLNYVLTELLLRDGVNLSYSNASISSLSRLCNLSTYGANTTQDWIGKH